MEPSSSKPGGPEQSSRSMALPSLFHSSDRLSPSPRDSEQSSSKLPIPSRPSDRLSSSPPRVSEQSSRNLPIPSQSSDGPDGPVPHDALADPERLRKRTRAEQIMLTIEQAIMAAHMGHKAVDPDSHIQWSRQTRGGKRIHYELMVIQQPERARACGSGPKSSADRRPVDPPPIVRLTVFEGETIGTAKDVTMDYNSDFFLFVSLEHARPMAHGRVQTPAATSPPVLTGVPVSACCYLDRPSPAGYFLFPDLSVRHEGRYKLIFRLYERNKDSQDLNPVDQSDNMEDEDGLFFTFLNEVRSQAFTVFSAKKFPGLAESTPLSRTVAEQGCRVRIRRDVRMRRRENKGAAQTNDFEPREDAQDRRTRSPADAYRNRSISNASERRASVYDHPPPPLAPSGRVLSFAAPTYNKPYQPTQAPTPHSEPVSPAAHTPSYRHNSFASASAYPPTPTYSHPYAERPAPLVVDDRRSSLTYQPVPAQPVSGYATLQPRPAMPPIDTGFIREVQQLPPMVKPELPSPTTAAMAGAGSGICGQQISSSLKRSYEEANNNEYSMEDLKSHLCYKRAGGNGSEKESPGYMGDDPHHGAPIDPQLRAEDERDTMKHSRKRSFRTLVDNERH